MLAAIAAVSTACSSSTNGPVAKDGGGHESADASADAVSPEELATEAFVWGYPLVVTQRTLQSLGAIVGVDTLFNQTALTTAGIRVIVAPNQDTLYSVSVLDLRSEPYVLSIPDVTDRYWTYQFLDAYMGSFHYLGTRATQGKGGTFAIVPPGYDGALPDGVERIESPTPELFLLGRYLVRDDTDATNVTVLDRKLTPLSAFVGTTAPPLPSPLGKPPGPPAETGANGATFFDELGDALASNPPGTEADRSALSRFAVLGIGPGLHPTSDGDSATRAALETGATQGLARVTEAAVAPADGAWIVRRDIGTYTDPLVRAAIAKFAWGANVPEESVYPRSTTDSNGDPYTGAKFYRIHFDADGLPPTDPLGFWSVTLYAPDMFFAENDIHRYAIGDRTPGLTKNPDGSLDLYVQHGSPAGHEGNWLPAPAGDFSLLMRVYLPGPTVLDGSYVYPTVTPDG